MLSYGLNVWALTTVVGHHGVVEATITNNKTGVQFSFTIPSHSSYVALFPFGL